MVNNVIIAKGIIVPKTNISKYPIIGIMVL